MNKLFNTLFWTFILMAIMAVLLKIVIGRLYESEESEKRIGSLVVSVKYNKAEAGEDRIFGYRVPYGIVWRTGSGDATEIRFSEDCFFGGKKIKAGTYSLWTVPGEKEWIVILNSETGQYGTRYDPSRDYLQIRVPSEKLADRRESLSIRVMENRRGKPVLQIRWEYTRVEVEIR
ncbi:DUF2911 domain-containing protein [Leadbetterella sp. DM7]|uniref:DUF2911 domain-containing protein n=1 Tax=Leadbetterella sp. DM7 TaxID=3235085 RepID=UPI00349EE7D2